MPLFRGGKLLVFYTIEEVSSLTSNLHITQPFLLSYRSPFSRLIHETILRSDALGRSIPHKLRLRKSPWLVEILLSLSVLSLVV